MCIVVVGEVKYIALLCCSCVLHESSTDMKSLIGAFWVCHCIPAEPAKASVLSQAYARNGRSCSRGLPQWSGLQCHR